MAGSTRRRTGGAAPRLVKIALPASCVATGRKRFGTGRRAWVALSLIAVARPICIRTFSCAATRQPETFWAASRPRRVLPTIRFGAINSDRRNIRAARFLHLPDLRRRRLLHQDHRLRHLIVLLHHRNQGERVVHHSKVLVRCRNNQCPRTTTFCASGSKHRTNGAARLRKIFHDRPRALLLFRPPRFHRRRLSNLRCHRRNHLRRTFVV